MNKELMKGSIDILLLSLISKKDMYGFEMVQKLKQTSDHNYVMSEGTLYPALKRLEKNGWATSYWGEESGGRRKYYRITEGGRTELERKLQDWQKVNQLIYKCSEGS
ncbi:DNA-binding PadR family transcriptional regulator [Oikeobacillus pervagus]|uniref:DNA-binding PadR family transcriptional regulator n=1 Tax=Oikeobacillus pervagus TaxID=1325931 RepID=A0AAJ1SZS7_9BACI|nr:PadR family transcriptional regulator [Oikeobacillus pervagus]MDQ0215875.1 DNA-binding PadR family transcriptional regulator [Oikeobacillus pervagus]